MNAKGDFPIVALIDCGEDEAVHQYRRNGTNQICFDTINAPAPKRKFVRWMNMYEAGGQTHGSREAADARAMSDRIACVRVEFEEGDGL